MYLFYWHFSICFIKKDIYIFNDYSEFMYFNGNIKDIFNCSGVCLDDILYTRIKNKRIFKYVFVLIAILAIGIILVSPIKNKFTTAVGRVDTANLSFIEAFTSGRSSFWSYDMYMILHNKIGQLIFGNGVNYLFYLNKPVFHVPLWAHNDYIQILSDYGILGLVIYIGLMVAIIKKSIKYIDKSKLIIIILVILWAFNAFLICLYIFLCSFVIPIFYSSVKI